MSRRDTHGLGYQRVDADEHVAVLVGAMDATARWEATVDADRFVSTVHDAARSGRFSMSLTIFAVIATATEA